MDCTQQFENLYSMHNIDGESYIVSLNDRFGWQKYGEIFLTRDLISVYVCSACGVAKDSAKVMNEPFVTGEIRQFWRHVQKCHGDITKVYIENFRKELSLEPAKKKLKVQNVIVIDDDDDENELLGEELLTEMEIEKKRQNAVSTKVMANQSNTQQKETENAGSLLVSLLQSTPKKSPKSESPKIPEDILMDYKPENEIISKQFCSIENQLREMHGDCIEIGSSLETILRVGVQNSNEPLENELKTKPSGEIYTEIERKDLDNSINEGVVDLNEVMGKEDESDAKDTLDYPHPNDDAVVGCEISKTCDLFSIGKESILKEHLSNNSTNKISKKYTEVIELSDCDEEEIEDEVEKVREEEATPHMYQIDIQLQSLHNTNNTSNNSTNNNNNITNHKDNTTTTTTNTPTKTITTNINNNNKSNNNNNNLSCSLLCERDQFDTNQKIMEHSEHQVRHSQQRSQSIHQMPTLAFQEQQQQEQNNQNNLITSNVELPAPEKSVKCNYCEQTFHASWQQLRHEKIHFPRQKTAPFYESPTASTNQSGQRPFKCFTCGIRTSTEKSMLKHMRRYHYDLQSNSENSKRTFQCNHCPLSYRSKQGMMIHSKRKHAILSTVTAPTSDADPEAVPDTLSDNDPATTPFTYDSPLATPLESNTLLQPQAETMKYYCRWHVESSYQRPRSTDSSDDLIESIGTLTSRP